MDPGLEGLVALLERGLEDFVMELDEAEGGDQRGAEADEQQGAKELSFPYENASAARYHGALVFLRVRVALLCWKLHGGSSTWRKKQFILRCGPMARCVLEGHIILKDADGKEWDLTGKPAISLCRCGLSEKRPFCDGAHARQNWQCETAPPGNLT